MSYLWSSIKQQIGEQLTNQPFHRIHWWSKKRWVDFIDPTPSKETPLWKLPATQLAKIQLFGCSPQALQKTITDYWAKPAWRRYLISWLTPIQQQVALWIYYQHCLAFQTLSTDASEASVIPEEAQKPILDQLAHKLYRHYIQLDNKVIKQYRHPILMSQITSYLQQAYNRGTNLLKKESKQQPFDEFHDKIASACSQAKDKINDYYTYVYSWTRHRNETILPHSIEEDVLPKGVENKCLIPSRQQTASILPQQRSSPTQNNQAVHLSFDTIEDWILSQHNTLIALLTVSKGVLQAQQALENSLTEVTDFMTVQITQLNRTSLADTQKLTQSLKKLWTQSMKLFHPDRYTVLNSPAWQSVITDCCQQFSQACTIAIKNLKTHIAKKATSTKHYSPDQLFQVKKELQILRQAVNQLEKEYENDRKKRQAALERDKQELQEKLDRLEQGIQLLRAAQSKRTSPTVTQGFFAHFFRSKLSQASTITNQTDNSHTYGA